MLPEQVFNNLTITLRSPYADPTTMQCDLGAIQVQEGIRAGARLRIGSMLGSCASWGWGHGFGLARCWSLAHCGGGGTASDWLKCCECCALWGWGHGFGLARCWSLAHCGGGGTASDWLDVGVLRIVGAGARLRIGSMLESCALWGRGHGFGLARCWSLAHCGGGGTAADWFKLWGLALPAVPLPVQSTFPPFPQCPCPS